MLKVFLLCVMTAALFLTAPAAFAQAPPRDNWGNFLFLFNYGEIDPFAAPWDAARYPASQDTLWRLGANVSCPVTISTNITWGLNHAWTTEWLKRPRTVMTPWFLWIDDVYGGRYPDPNLYAPWGCYNNPEVKPHFEQVLTKIRDAYGERILRVQGKPVINFEKENPYTASHHPNRHFCKYCQFSFIAWLKQWYGDASPAQDTNGDGVTMNAQCGTTAAIWERLFKGGYDDENTFRTMAEEKYRYPYFQFLWQRWLEDNAWRDFYLDIAQKTGVWQFCTELMPSRYLAGQPFIYEYGYTSHYYYTGDYWTRRDPEKIAVAYNCALYRTNADTDPYFYDRYLAQVCGSISRFRGIYQIEFDGSGTMELARYQAPLRYHPEALEAYSWWAHTLGQQRWLFDQLLTHAPAVAVYPGEQSFPALNAVNTLYTELAKAGYPAHYLDRDMLLAGALKDYKVLLVNGERIPREVMEKIEAFRKQGGYVCGLFNAMSWSLAQPEPERFAQLFGATPARIIRGKTNISQVVDERSPIAKAAVQVDGLPAYELVDAILCRGVKAYWEDGVFREDYLQLVKPATARLLARVKGGDAGEACATVSEDGKALFLGMHMASQATTRLQFITNFLESAGVHQAVDCDNPRVESYLLESANGATRVIVLINDDLQAQQQVTVTPAALPAGMQCRELKSMADLPMRDGKISLAIPPGQVRLLLIAPEVTCARVMQVQRQAAADARLFPWQCSRHFFIRRDFGTNAYAAISKAYLEMEAQPNCIIVLGERATDADRAFAKQVTTLIREWPLGKNAVEIPVKTDTEITPEEKARYNLLLIGGAQENRCTKAEFARTGLAPARGGICSYHEKGWYSGGNFVAITGTPQERARAFTEFLDWMRVWIDGDHSYVPEKRW